MVVCLWPQTPKAINHLGKRAQLLGEGSRGGPSVTCLLLYEARGCWMGAEGVKKEEARRATCSWGATLFFRGHGCVCVCVCVC